MAEDRQVHFSAVVHVERGGGAWDRGGAGAIPSLLEGHPRARRMGDVYAALARLLQRGGEGGFVLDAVAVVVGVDGLLEPELEFFRLLRSARPGVTLLVYSACGDEAGVERALRAGAHGRAGAADVARLLAESPPPESALPAPVSQDRGATELREPTNTGGEARGSEVIPPCTAVHDDAVASELHEKKPEVPDGAEAVPDADAGLEEEAASSGPRVPWLRYKDRPVRLGPGGRSPSPVNRAGDENGMPGGEGVASEESGAGEGSRAAECPPLLSEEELRALLEDDVSALAPGEDLGRPGSQRAEG